MLIGKGAALPSGGYVHMSCRWALKFTMKEKANPPATQMEPSINSGISKWVIHQKNNKDDSLFDDDYDFTVI